MGKLNLALIHMSVRHKKPDENRELLLRLISQAAAQGADIVVAPEMAISGYSFDSCDDIDSYAEPESGPTSTALAELTGQAGIYACVGLAEKELPTGILHNSVFAFGPEGRIICKYRKISSEAKWACPGDPKQDNTFETPWGCAGVLICSDTHYGLMPRLTALRGADLLLAPSNWPPSGLDPTELWRARALENGFYLAACNRTGVDKIMDCREATSCVYGPSGQLLFSGKNEDSQIFHVELPLDRNGRLEGSLRRQCLSERRPSRYRECYLNLRMIRNITTFLELPKPGDLNLHCIVPGEGQHPVDAFFSHLRDNPSKENGLYVLPPFDFSSEATHRIEQRVNQEKIGTLACSRNDGRATYRLFEFGKDMRQWELPTWPSENDPTYAVADFGPARLFLTPFSAMAHPEMAVVASKRGCDLALSIEEKLSSEQKILAAVRTIENLVTSVCCGDGAGIWTPPDGHKRWGESLAGPAECCHVSFDTNRTRSKRFQDSIDFQLLLRKQKEE